MAPVITESTVDKLAHLARLSFEGESKQKIIKDLNNILGFVEKLNELDTEGVPALTHISSEINNLREDKVIQNITREDALKNAPKKDSFYFRVPKVIGE
ncbi:MAG: asparaginyl/glutamyl-tRNA amidotransferase subunit C [Bacteroidetes bacterium RIFCSPLOWO2_02_FULL_36_8]|nr:MAG: asparaginyl/glutamyl-tRNA amidotransferase subunit C [Bacteroidetes bacterium RIFCSPLOWO2_02_FULL_36_8]OFY72065.1 MAG: asparaginyl/glutamyl-tRNA amidotransferase subunit C [Bacteroidetes bacterium RIFCSPLOWO2_12_FULL_37_12]